MTKYQDASGMTVRPKDVNYRSGPRWRGILRGETEGRRAWMKSSVSRRSVVGRRYATTSRMELAVEHLLESDHPSYEGLFPVASTFALVEEAALLHAPDYGEEDARKERPNFRKSRKHRVPFRDPNFAGRSSSGMGQTIKGRKVHGWTCECCDCSGCRWVYPMYGKGNPKFRHYCIKSLASYSWTWEQKQLRLPLDERVTGGEDEER